MRSEKGEIYRDEVLATHRIFYGTQVYLWDFMLFGDAYFPILISFLGTKRNLRFYRSKHNLPHTIWRLSFFLDTQFRF
jgi:hypothetical protein